MNTLGIILARAGSVGLPGKHLRPLLGEPVVARTFADARAAGSLSRVVVSTDCEDVKRLARAGRFETIDRPAALATSDASVQDALLHALRGVEARGSFRADAVVLLYGNVAVRPAGLIDAAVDKLRATGCDSVRSFTPVGKWHPTWMSAFDGDRVVPNAPGSIHRRQDLQKLWLHDGGVVAVSRASLLRGEATLEDPHAFFGEDRRGVEVAAGSVVEVDEERDLWLAEATLRARGEGAAAMRPAA